MLFDCENFDSHNGYSDMARLIQEADEACNARDTAGCLDAINCLYALFDAAGCIDEILNVFRGWRGDQ